MCHQNGIQCADVFADQSQPARDLAPAQPSVHQDARAVGGDKSRIARTAAGENADFDDGSESF
jgi:hypothetical protein